MLMLMSHATSAATIAVSGAAAVQAASGHCVPQLVAPIPLCV
jgi:hypothetical protein